MTVVERIYKPNELPSTVAAFARDTVTLGWVDRTHVHGRRRTDGGVEFGTSLPRGTVLRDGDVFVLEAEHLVVTIVERPDPVFVVVPGSAQEWALFAYHIGNRHQPVMITDPFTPTAAVAAHSH
jgi:urease accessory protein UreE